MTSKEKNELEKTQETENTPELKSPVDLVVQKVEALQSRGELHFPPNYSPENALRSAWLNLQTVTDRNDKPALEVCSQSSIVNSMFSMVIQGLNPDKKQCYFIAYGKELALSVSYYGHQAVAMRVAPQIKHIVAEVVYEGDTLKYRLTRGRKEVTDHEQELKNVDGKKIVAAYCMVIDNEGELIESVIMTFEEIKQCWKQSKMKPIDDKGNIKTSSTHAKFPERMSRRTVINRTLNPIINNSDDASLELVVKEFHKSRESEAEAAVAAEIEETANKDAIDITAAQKDLEPDAKTEEPKTDSQGAQVPSEAELNADAKQAELVGAGGKGPDF